jgi:imidazolonepropionase-like amidohydrolase
VENNTQKDEGRIKVVDKKNKVTIPPDYKQFDLTGKYVIPGLINAHAHLIGDDRPRDISTPEKQRKLVHFVGTSIGKKLALKMIRKNVTNALNSGVTTIRAVGDPHGYDLLIRNEVQQGKLAGPCIFAAGKLICPSGGHGTAMGRVADSPWEFRREVRNAVHNGADFIKIMSTGGVSDSTKIGQAGRPEMTLDEITAACDEAHRAGLKLPAMSRVL